MTALSLLVVLSVVSLLVIWCVLMVASEVDDD